MRVNTGAVTIGVGALIVGTLSVAGIMTVRDENNTDPRLDCQPQPEDVAQAAQEGFVDKYVTRARGGDLSATASFVLTSEAARDLMAPDPLPEWSDSGYVVVVDYDPPKDVAELPVCFDDTPVLYSDSDWTQVQ